MTLQDATHFFQNLITNQTKSSEQKVYTDFIKLLRALEHHNLSDTEVLGIEQHLDGLQLKVNSTNKSRNFKRKLHIFKKYLKDKHGLVSKDYYSGIGIAMGLCFGMLAGLLFGDPLGIDNGLVIGMVFGMLFGMIIGKKKDTEAAQQNKVLETT